MNIGILSKRTTMLAGKLKQYYENKGFDVTIYTLENRVINETLFKNDFYVLKSKDLFFLYAAYYIEANNIPVIPSPTISYKLKNRVEAHFLIHRAGLNVPDFYMGTPETLKTTFQTQDFPLILKPIMGSGSRGIIKINNSEDLNFNHEKILYLEKYITGEHYIVYFIGNEISTSIKPPLSNEHADMERINTPDDIKNVIKKWRKCLNGSALFGHLDIVREKESNKLYVVDPGSFPQFTRFRGEKNIKPAELIGDLILNKIKRESNLKI